MFLHILQAYTQELENAVSQLNEENARLKKEQEKVSFFLEIKLYQTV